ncbi:MAG: glycosyltransferase [Verrucomicrobia bacterium]|nr:glycosyltransferase [Verrucomicrobiota bacterium]MCH8511956.1 glycosyltransferase [Kiritimatiellia bacterium]
MKILFFTNTYLPHVGGVAQSVHTLETAFRALGHEVRIVAPEFDDAKADPNVLRVPAIQNFNGSDFSVRIPIPNVVGQFVDDFEPDIVHSHHPFLLGDAALRIARRWEVPIVFTHHTLYERYTHYVPFDSPALKRMAVKLSTEYCNLCDLIVAPSESIATLLKKRGVETPIESIPTGIDLDTFAGNHGDAFRAAKGIPKDATVIGTVGRMAKEKNLPYLVEAVARYLKKHPKAAFLAVGDGNAKAEMLSILKRDATDNQIFAVGKLSGQELLDAYAAMDCFVFASQTETQGIVLAEALASGNPVVALDGPGVREIVMDEKNGFLLSSDASPDTFATALEKLLDDTNTFETCSTAARPGVESYATKVCAQRMLSCYQKMAAEHTPADNEVPDFWHRILTELESEWDLMVAKSAAIRVALNKQGKTEVSLD